MHTDKKEETNFSWSKEIQSGSGAKSYLRKGFIKYGEMRKYLVIYDPLWIFLIHGENFLFFFSSAEYPSSAYLSSEKEAVGSAELLQADQLHQDGGGQRIVGRDAEPVHTRQG